MYVIKSLRIHYFGSSLLLAKTIQLCKYTNGTKNEEEQMIKQNIWINDNQVVQ